MLHHSGQSFLNSALKKLANGIVGHFIEAPVDCPFAQTIMDYYHKKPEIAFFKHNISYISLYSFQ